MRYLVRLDDITPYMDKYKFNAVRAVLDRYDIHPIIGIVPDCRDTGIYGEETNRYTFAEYRNLLTELISAGWIPAQHGTNHVYTTTDHGLLGINPFSEFAGLSFDTQYTKLKQGKEKLRQLGIEVSLFMAPGHTFDENTLKALRALGYSAVTDGLCHNPYIREDILFIPCTLTAYGRIKGTDTICLHPNLMDEHDISELERFIRNHRDEALTYNEDDLRAMAEEYTASIAFAEFSTLKLREKRSKIAASKKLSNYMTYTDHPNKAVKWLKRLILSPLLLTGRFRS